VIAVAPGRARLVGCLIGLAAGVCNVAIAQEPPPRAQPPDMQAIADALGVECQFCHAPQALTSAGRPRLEVAREMIAMTSELNTRVARATGTEGARVSCVTCHRGVTIPRQLRDILLETALRQGPDAVVAQYRELRARYYGGQAYDFGETTLLFVAERLVDGRPAAAIALADLNLEFHPRSWRSHLTRGIALTRRLETTPDALESFRKALAIDPGNGVVEGWIVQTEPLARRARPR
jgi:hypothetical protein